MSASVELVQDSNTHAVECPACGKEGRVEPGLYLCSGCGSYFTVKGENCACDCHD